MRSPLNFPSLIKKNKTIEIILINHRNQMSYPKQIPSMDQYNDYNSKLRSLKLTPTQRRKLLNSHRQEEIKSMILNKYLEKRKINPSILKESPQLQSIVTNFLQSEKLTEKNLAGLYGQIQGKIQVLATINKQPSKELIPEQENRQIKEKTQIQPEKKQILDKEAPENNDDFDEDSETERRSLYKANEQDNEWSMIVKHKQRMYEEDLKASQLKEKQKKENFKQDLDRQLALKKELAQKSSKTNDIIESRIRDYVINQEANLGDKNEKRKKLWEDERNARDALFREVTNRMKREKKQEAELDRSLVARAKEELFREQENQKKKKMEYQLSLRKIMEENEQNRLRISELERSQEKLSEIKAMTEENEMIERKESQKKKNEEIFRSSKVKEFIKGSTTKLALKEKLETIRKEELNHLKYQSEIEKKQNRREEMQRKIQEEQKALLRSSLEHQMKEKESLKKIEDDLNRKQAEFWRKDIEDYRMEEERKKMKIKEENMKTLEIVRQQMQETEKKKEMLKAMNDLELMQNKGILKDISREAEGVKKTVITVKKHI